MRRSEGRQGPARSPGRARDRGYVTAETAIVVPMLVALTGLLVWGVLAAAAEVRCVDAARAGAREAARSEAPADVLRAAAASAPAGARVSVRREGDLVRVRVVVPAPRFPVTLTAEAAALAEDTVDAGGGP